MVQTKTRNGNKSLVSENHLTKSLSVVKNSYEPLESKSQLQLSVERKPMDQSFKKVKDTIKDIDDRRKMMKLKQELTFYLDSKSSPKKAYSNVN